MKYASFLLERIPGSPRHWTHLPIAIEIAYQHPTTPSSLSIAVASRDWNKPRTKLKRSATIGAFAVRMRSQRPPSRGNCHEGDDACRLQPRLLLLRRLGSHAPPWPRPYRLFHRSSEFWMVGSAEHVRICEKSRASSSVFSGRKRRPLSQLVSQELSSRRFSAVRSMGWIWWQGRAGSCTQRPRSPARPRHFASDMRCVRSSRGVLNSGRKRF
jgi:hypothetical protein